MTRLIPLTLHSAIEIALGAAVMASPFVFGFGPAGLVTAVVIGALLVGLGLSSSGDGGRGSIPVAAHAAYDGGLAVGLLIAAAALGIAGEAAALAVLAAAGVAHIALNATTRYTAAGY